MVSKNIYLSLVILLIISSQIVAREMNSEDPASLTQAMIGNTTSEAKGVFFNGRHVLKYLGKIFKFGKVIDCKRCKSCNGLCGYCCD
ncbi:hypothetical protein R3W88_025912 [Solanum pinnatisectum]|uniref:Uncharacterized protein n=1 Tax=Solanum pinnatisectum TaxID=50273 RepID=A0AAV9M501_9SOLN|nr:hypothetical protein R3W88_025912 [Solanum pinnatisectum]